MQADLGRQTAADPGASRGARRSGLVVAAITLVFAAATFALGQRIWTAPPGAATPPGSLLPLFIVLEVVSDILFGLGVSFIVFGYGLVARARQPLWLAYATYVSIAWLMVNWWPHGNLHRVTPAGAWAQLLYIDYGFHLTLMVAVAIVALFFFRTLRGQSAP